MTRNLQPEDGPGYWLPDHVYTCVTDDGAVFLDVRKDLYVGVDKRCAAWLATVVGNWPAETTRLTAAPTMGTKELASTASTLLDRGLLTHAQPAGHGKESRKPPPASMSRVGRYSLDEPTIRLPDVVRFLRACIGAACALRCLSFEHVIETLRQRQGRTSTDEARAIDLAAIFFRLRPYLFTAKDRCLFQALALTRFLASYGVASSLVMGVRTMPFAAHSWVQTGSAIFDDKPENVCLYTPILAI